VFPVTVPPLRDRREDIPLLARHLVARFAASSGRRIDHIPAAIIEQLQQHAWPGNIRELENLLQRAVIVSHNGTLHLDSSDELTLEQPVSDLLQDVERAHILRILVLKSWRIEGTGGAAHTLGLKPSTLRSRMQRLGIRRNGGPPRPLVGVGDR
jgi:formate hydrogenlyase transcriptional activator